MRNLKQRVIFSFLILYICYGITMAMDSSCGDWEPYKDEKCFKIFDKVVSEEEAEKICSQQENSSTLITIHSKDEQDFLSNFLYKTNKLVDAVWIGVKYSSNWAKFKWTDGSDLSYTNWARESPQNVTGYDCVQMIADATSMGKWINEPCKKKNSVVCQKMQIWSLSHMQTAFLDQRKLLNDLIKSNLSFLIPIGFIYVQLPNQNPPTEIWPLFTWSDVSSAYGGLFFRVLGGNSASFGSTQSADTYRITNLYWAYDKSVSSNDPATKREIPKIGNSTNINGYLISNLMLESNGPSNDDIRPINTAIRIWKRTK